MQHEINERLKRLPDIIKAEGYSDVQAFRQVYDKATALVEQYNRDLAASEQQAAEKKKPKRERARNRKRH